MKEDALEQFRIARQNLERERQDLVGRITEIDAVLASQGVPAPAVRRPGRPPSDGRSAAGSRRGRRGGGRGGMSMREAAMEVLKSGKKDIRQLVEGIQNIGYQFASKNPKNSLAVMLYTNKKVFNGKRGMFSLK